MDKLPSNPFLMLVLAVSTPHFPLNCLLRKSKNVHIGQALKVAKNKYLLFWCYNEYENYTHSIRVNKKNMGFL